MDIFYLRWMGQIDKKKNVYVKTFTKITKLQNI